MAIKKNSTLDKEYPYYSSAKVWIRRKELKLLPGDDGEDVKVKIGSSWKNNSVLRAFNAEAEAKYLPIIIGSDPSKQDWAKATEDYWKSLSVEVPSDPGLELEIGFKYKTEEDAKADKDGIPLNPANYVLYRYCLVYSRVANSIEEINNSPKIRFYIYDEALEITIKTTAAETKRKAMQKYLELYTDPIAVDAILSVLKVGVGLSLTAEKKALAFTEIFEANPQEFLKVASDNSLLTKALIQKALNKGHIRQIPNTQTYVLGENVIASSLEDLVAKLNDENEKSLRTQIEALIKNLK